MLTAQTQPQARTEGNEETNAPGPLTPGQDCSEVTCAGVSSKNKPQVPTPLSPAFPSLPHFSPRPVPLESPPKTTRRRLLLEKPKPQQSLFRGLS